MILGMEKACEFCGKSRAAIYCGADAAYLCLCCDARVHSANTLSTRHHRSVLCDTCRFGPAQWRDPRGVMCGPCSRGPATSVRPFSGCPSADNFAALWGFKPSDIVTSQLKVLQKPQEKGNRGYILQQIVELKRLQMSEGNSYNNQILGQQINNSVSSMRQFVKKYNGEQQLQDSIGPDLTNEKPDTSNDLNHDEGIEESFPFPFSQLGNSVNTEPLWQNSQLWSQNMQDLGVCEEFVFQEDLNIPEVDSTFRNFEDMFGGDHDQMQSLLDENDQSFFSVDKDLSIEKFETCRPGTMEDISMTSTISDTDRDTSISKVHNLNSSRFLSVSPSFSDGETSLDSYDNKSRMHEKYIRYPSRKREDTRKRIKTRSVNIGDCDSDNVDVTRSY